MTPIGDTIKVLKELYRKLLDPFIDKWLFQQEAKAKRITETKTPLKGIHWDSFIDRWLFRQEANPKRTLGNQKPS